MVQYVYSVQAHILADPGVEKRTAGKQTEGRVGHSPLCGVDGREEAHYGQWCAGTVPTPAAAIVTAAAASIQCFILVYSC